MLKLKPMKPIVKITGTNRFNHFCHVTNKIVEVPTLFKTPDTYGVPGEKIDECKTLKKT